MYGFFHFAKIPRLLKDEIYPKFKKLIHQTLVLLQIFPKHFRRNHQGGVGKMHFCDSLFEPKISKFDVKNFPISNSGSYTDLVLSQRQTLYGGNYKWADIFDFGKITP